MALMAKHGEITPMPKAAIFADTQAEPKSVYDWLAWLETQLSFPVYRVTRGDLAEKALRLTGTEIPFFTANPDGSQGKVLRSCTRDFKVTPLLRAEKTMGTSIVTWLGISLDEASRMKPSQKPWVVHRWPLIELRMRRSDCLLWMEEHGYPRPPRSACVFCPYHNDSEWRRLRDEEPAEFQRAVEFERKLQAVRATSEKFRGVPYLHRSLVPLDQVDLSTAEERGQLNMFQNECEGMCGV